MLLHGTVLLAIGGVTYYHVPVYYCFLSGSHEYSQQLNAGLCPSPPLDCAHMQVCRFLQVGNNNTAAALYALSMAPGAARGLVLNMPLLAASHGMPPGTLMLASPSGAGGLTTYPAAMLTGHEGLEGYTAGNLTGPLLSLLSQPHTAVAGEHMLGVHVADQPGVIGATATGDVHEQGEGGQGDAAAAVQPAGVGVEAVNVGTFVGETGTGDVRVEHQEGGGMVPEEVTEQQEQQQIDTSGTATGVGESVTAADMQTAQADTVMAVQVADQEQQSEALAQQGNQDQAAADNVQEQTG